MKFVWFIGKKCIAAHFGAIGVATFLLTIGNASLRMAYMPTLASLPTLCLVMLPLILMFAVPPAVCVGNSFALGELVRGEQLRMSFLMPHARRACIIMMTTIALLLMACMAPVILEWAPTSYARGKQLIYGLVREQLTSLQPGILHTPFPGLACQFARVSIDQNTDETIFHEMLWGVSDKKEGIHIFVAKRALLTPHMLYLFNGSVSTIQQDKVHTATFGRSELSLSQYFDTPREKDTTHQLKFLGIRALYNASSHGQSAALLELGKRISLLLWIFVLLLSGTFLILAYAPVQATQLHLLKYSLAPYFVYLCSHFFAATGNTVATVLFLYFIIPLLTCGICWWLFRRTW